MYFDRNTVTSRKRVYEVIDPHSETEQAGYIPPQVQIENMILAGQRLDASRRALYDFDSEEDIDEDAYDPTRSGNFDLADATRLAMEAEASIAESQKASKVASKAPEKAPEASTEPVPTKGA